MALTKKGIKQRYFVPYAALGNDEPLGIIKLIRASVERPLTILEQAKMIDELEKIFVVDHSVFISCP